MEPQIRWSLTKLIKSCQVERIAGGLCQKMGRKRLGITKKHGETNGAHQTNGPWNKQINSREYKDHISRQKTISGNFLNTPQGKKMTDGTQTSFNDVFGYDHEVWEVITLWMTLKGLNTVGTKLTKTNNKGAHSKVDFCNKLVEKIHKKFIIADYGILISTLSIGTHRHTTLMLPWC